jgi:hypothetical protein
MCANAAPLHSDSDPLCPPPPSSLAGGAQRAAYAQQPAGEPRDVSGRRALPHARRRLRRTGDAGPDARVPARAQPGPGTPRLPGYRAGGTYTYTTRTTTTTTTTTRRQASGAPKHSFCVACGPFRLAFDVSCAWMRMRMRRCRCPRTQGTRWTRLCAAASRLAQCLCQVPARTSKAWPRSLRLRPSPPSRSGGANGSGFGAAGSSFLFAVETEQLDVHHSIARQFL